MSEPFVVFKNSQHPDPNKRKRVAVNVRRIDRIDEYAEKETIIMIGERNVTVDESFQTVLAMISSALSKTE